MSWEYYKCNIGFSRTNNIDTAEWHHSTTGEWVKYECYASGEGFTLLGYAKVSEGDVMLELL